MKKIMVTGAAGFIGSALCERLASDGWGVLGIDNLNSYYPVELKMSRLKRMGFAVGGIEEFLQGHNQLKSKIYPELYFVRGDITDRAFMEHEFSTFRPDAVMNLAAQAGVRYSIENPYTYVTNNIDGFLVLLECARHWPVEKFVYASSSSVYGDHCRVPFSESDSVDSPVSLYAATKMSNELMARAYNTLFGIPAIGLRFFTVYGPWGRPDMAPMLFASAITRGEKIKVFNNGDLSRDFTYIDDIVDGIARVIEDPRPSLINDLYNIGHGSPVRLMDFISILEKEIGGEADKEYLPMQKGDVKTTYADTSRLERDYGYRPATSLEDGLHKFACWYNSEENVLR